MKKARDLMDKAVDRRVFSGGVVLAATAGTVVFESAHGYTRYRGGAPVTSGTLFDLASLTKPLAGAAAALVLSARGEFGLGLELGDLVPEFRDTEKARVTMVQLLGHSSGFPAWKPYYEVLESAPPETRKSRLLHMLVNEPLAYEPGTATEYSDPGYMALGFALERAAGTPLDRFCAEAVYRPLGVKDLFYLPVGQGPPAGRDVAATEDCPRRGRLLAGEVHDDNCHAMGGVCAHAGLFGTAWAVFAVARDILAARNGRTDAPVFDPDHTRRFLTIHPGPGSFVAGFDTPTRPASSSGEHFSDSSVGHLGFTGVSLWMDPEKDVIVVLLTNRVHPDRENDAIKSFRPALHDAIMDTLSIK
ncbi:MAG: serine hydrolase domain-containing protein [Desulfatibacillaceae bacterium]